MRYARRRATYTQKKCSYEINLNSIMCTNSGPEIHANSEINILHQPLIWHILAFGEIDADDIRENCCLVTVKKKLCSLLCKVPRLPSISQGQQ